MNSGARFSPTRLGRAVFRCIGFLVISLGAVLDFLLFYRVAPLRRRARWQQYWGRRFVWLFGLEIEIHGAIPQQGIIVANHLGYVDILVLAAITPCVFVAKSEVANWPVLGVLARMAGTIFIDRSRRVAVGAVNARVEAATSAGLCVALFPEGTSTDGRTVLPFKASLLEPACRTGVPLTPGALNYRLDEGSVATAVCYWGEMTLLPHLFGLFKHRRVYAQITFGEMLRRVAPRKELAVILREKVSQLRIAGHATCRITKI